MAQLPITIWQWMGLQKESVIQQMHKYTVSLILNIQKSLEKWSIQYLSDNVETNIKTIKKLTNSLD